MSRPSVYLAGPIQGLSYNGCTEWREEVSRQLAPDIKAFSPMRGKEYLQHEIAIAHSYDEQILSCPKGIVTRDRFDTTRVNLVIMNVLGATKVSIGTMVELGWADAARVPIVLAIEGETNPHWHAFTREIPGFIVPTLQDAIYIARAILLQHPRGK